jgi:hypothetical protein
MKHRAGKRPRDRPRSFQDNICTFKTNRCRAGERQIDHTAAVIQITMKTTRTFKGSWLLFAMVVAILIGEIVAWEVSSQLGVRNNPLVVAFLSMGLVAGMASVLYEGADLD